MRRILLADDSAHAQRMGVRILKEEGFDVVSVTDGDSAVKRLGDADPDLILADVFLPGKSGVELCRYVKGHPKHRRARVVLTAGVLDAVDEAAAKEAGCDAIIRKPFEASTVIRTVKPLLEEAEAAAPEIDDERVRAAVTVALDAAFPALVDEIAARVLEALRR